MFPATHQHAERIHKAFLAQNSLAPATLLWQGQAGGYKPLAAAAPTAAATASLAAGVGAAAMRIGGG